MGMNGLRAGVTGSVPIPILVAKRFCSTQKTKRLRFSFFGGKLLRLVVILVLQFVVERGERQIGFG